MSSGVDPRDQVAGLRAMAHPVRLRILSLLTGTAMSAAEIARELDLTHANASYHVRQLSAVGLLVEAGEESIRGGKAKRYRYDLDHAGSSAADPADAAGYYQAIAGELVRRASGRRSVGTRGTSSDAELWVPRAAWDQALEAVSAAIRALHVAAAAPRSEGTLHVSVTAALFEMDPDR